MRHMPGEFQCADLGTKPFPRERLRHLVKLWNIHDRKEKPLPEARVRSVGLEPTWLQRLLLLCQVCGSMAQEERLQAEIPWDLYVAVIVLAIAVVALWEVVKGCARRSEVKIKALRAKATKSSENRLTRNDLKELQRLLALDPRDLSTDQKFRIVELREKFNETMPENTSPVPRFTTPREEEASSFSQVPRLFTPSREETSLSSTNYNKQPKTPLTKDQEVQVDLTAFTRVEPPPRVEYRMVQGPFYQVPGRDVLHVFPECWGKRNTSRKQTLNLCRCCIENGGNRIY